MVMSSTLVAVLGLGAPGLTTRNKKLLGAPGIDGSDSDDPDALRQMPLAVTSPRAALVEPPPPPLPPQGPSGVFVEGLKESQGDLENNVHVAKDLDDWSSTSLLTLSDQKPHGHYKS